MIKPLAIAIAAGTLALSAASSSHAVDLGAGFSASANAAVTSNYMFRGFTQTRNGAAIQGGADLAHESGFYVGTWLSTVDFKLVPGAEYEQDIYVGWGKSFGELAVDLMYNKYLYPSEKGLEFAETSLTLSAYGFSLGIDYANDFQMVGNSTGTVDKSSTINYDLSYSYELPHGYVLDATVGRYDFKEAGFFGGDKDKYTYYNIGVTKTFWGVDFNVSYTDSSLNGDSCEIYAGGKDYCGDVFYISASKTFE